MFVIHSKYVIFNLLGFIQLEKSTHKEPNYLQIVLNVFTLHFISIWNWRPTNAFFKQPTLIGSYLFYIFGSFG